MKTPKTLEEHREYLYKIVRLQLFFLARWKKNHPDEGVTEILRNRVDIFRKTDLNPEALNPVGAYFRHPAWLAFENRIAEIYERVNGDESNFEEWAFDFIRPRIDNRCERDYNDRSSLSTYQCGFLKHNPGLETARPGELRFHIANDRTPDSFFNDPEHIRECFTKLLDIAEEKFHATRIGTGTWLNSVPKWLALFPEEWNRNLEPENRNVQWHYGFWGQFITSRGTFNDKFGEQTRATGELPYYPRNSNCAISAMRAKLACRLA